MTIKEAANLLIICSENVIKYKKQRDMQGRKGLAEFTQFFQEERFYEEIELNLIPSMPVIPVVLDSCVIFPMPLCNTLLRAAKANLYRVHFSQEIIDGTTRNLVDNPPLNVTELLNKLGKQVPEFVSKVWLTIQNLED